MADVTRVTLDAASFVGDDNAIVAAGDIAAVLDVQSGRQVIQFPDGSDEHAAVSLPFVWPSQYTSGNSVKVKLYAFGDSAPGENNVARFDVAFEAVTVSDAHDLPATADCFASEQSADGTVDADAGELWSVEITLTQAQADAIEAGDVVRLCVRRDSDHANDTYADTVWLYAVEILEVIG